MLKNPHKRFKDNTHVPKKSPNYHKDGFNLDHLDGHARESGLRGLKAHLRSVGVKQTSKRLEKYGLHDDFNHVMRVGQSIALAAGRMKLH